MRPKCKFCGEEIHDDHYFITKTGTICLKCKEKIKDEISSFNCIHSDLYIDTNRLGGKTVNA